MKHEDIIRLFQAWSAGRADAAARSRIQEHLAGCDTCRRYYETMTLLLEKPDASLLPRLEPDPFLPTRIRALAAAGPGTPERIRRFGLVRTSIATITFIVAVAAGIVLGTGLSNVLTSSYNETAVVEAYSDAFSQSGFADSWEEVVAYNNEEEK